MSRVRVSSSFLTIRGSIKASGYGTAKQAGYMTASLHRSIRSIILAFSGASIHDNTWTTTDCKLKGQAILINSTLALTDTNNPSILNDSSKAQLMPGVFSC